MREQHLLQNDAVLRSVHPWGCSLECDGSAGPHTPPITSGHVATRGRLQDVGLLVTATRKKTIITVGNYQRGAITDATGATFSGILQAYDAVVDFYDLLVKAEQKKQNGISVSVSLSLCVSPPSLSHSIIIIKKNSFWLLKEKKCREKNPNRDAITFHGTRKTRGVVVW